MGLLQNANAIPTAAAAADFYSYQINQSCRFDGSSSVLTKTWGASATDDDKFAISVWVKGHHTDGTWGVIASSAQSELMSLYVQARSDSDAHAIGYYTGNGGNNAASLALGRDVSAWRHIVMIYDSSQGAGADRLKISATLSSVGTPSFSISANDCSHGDLGRITNQDILILISYSGKTDEL